jgi:hypothetical protein
MATKLKQLIDKIDYKNLFDADARRVERVLAQYGSARNTVENYDEFKKCLIEFVGDIYGAIINTPNAFKSANDSIMYDLALRFLNAKYPGNTETTVYEIMRSGAEGGVYQVLKTLAQIMSDKIYRDGVDHYIGRYLDEIGFEGREAAVKEYLAEYGSILPTNYKNDPNMVLISFDKVLHEHALMMKRLR